MLVYQRVYKIYIYIVFYIPLVPGPSEIGPQGQAIIHVFIDSKKAYNYHELSINLTPSVAWVVWPWPSRPSGPPLPGVGVVAWYVVATLLDIICGVYMIDIH